MKFLSGPISDRIRSGEIDASTLNKPRTSTAEEAPTPSAIRSAEGHGLGSGATSARTPTGNDAA